MAAGRRVLDIIDTYLVEVQRALSQLSPDEVRAAVDVLYNAWQRDATVFVIGNGGSASTASHVMNDLCKCTKVEGLRPFRALALSDNIPLMTAIANDDDYSAIFETQLETFLRPGDVVVAISGSGNSANIVRACRYALEHDAMVMGWCGRPGGMLAKLADSRIIVEADRIGQQEDVHLMLGHMVSLALRERLQQHFERPAPELVSVTHS